MTKCFFCNSIIKSIPFRCKYCGLTFCDKHRIPESHSCLFDLNIEFEKLIYEDGLDFMEQKLTVARIYEYVMKKELNKVEALKLLKMFIESSSLTENRIHGLIAIELLNLGSKGAFEILQNSLISDENHEVRKTAARVLSKVFPKKSKELLKYAINGNLI